MYISLRGSRETPKTLVLCFSFLSLLLLDRHALLSSIGVFPFLSAITLLLLSSYCLYITERFIETYYLQVAGLQQDSQDEEAESDFWVLYLPSYISCSPTLIKSLLSISFASTLVVLRLLLWAKMQQDIGCLTNMEIGLLPWMCSLGDFLFNNRFSYKTVTEAVQTTISKQFLMASITALSFILSTSHLLQMINAPTSTYICFSASNLWINMQHVASTFLDALLISYAVNLIKAYGTKKKGVKSILKEFALVAMSSAAFLCAIRFIYFLRSDEPTPLSNGVNEQYLGHLLLTSILLISAIIFSIHFLLHSSALEYAFILVTAHVHARLLTGRFPIEAILYLAIFYLGIYFAIFRKAEIFGVLSSRKKLNMPTGRNLILIGLALSTPSYRLIRTKFRLADHPIDALISAAQPVHHGWLARASKSKNLGEAFKNYQLRYARDPPPGFDKWYHFATSRNSVIIDDFDQIQADLLPFWSLSPEELRERVWQASANRWNEIALLKIRNGSVDMGPNNDPTHRWMVEGVKLLIQSFAEHVPDMDLPLNLNDESRVAVPWDNMQVAMAKSLPKTPRKPSISSVWSMNRASGWRNEVEQMGTFTRFKEQSWKNSFSSYAARTCHPLSLARREPYWNTGKLCKKCIQAHSLGSFVSNWSLSADICHQPDLSRLHGFFLSPAAFKVTNALVPVFSQSKVPGFSDIIYPSAWNYMEKVQYQPTDQFKDPIFSQKINSLFWRGGTTEGYSKEERWKGMTRQRLVWLTNPKDSLQSTPLIMPQSHGNGWWITDSIVNRDLLRLSNTSIVHKFDRCTQEDCLEQSEAFELAESIDFQGHWKYKYLFDLDGAGFSGRFIAFLRSRSLPFKSAIFREWYSSRITPWLHFVPQDIRLHDVYSTLLYFNGICSKKDGSETQVGAHESEATLIAEQGRDWANKVLRKEDMEIYMFRLLLEWGRLTDDRRDVIGFTL